jgi:hypothetical protein
MVTDVTAELVMPVTVQSVTNVTAQSVTAVTDSLPVREQSCGRRTT